jgi:hypothetical protein
MYVVPYDPGYIEYNRNVTAGIELVQELRQDSTALRAI